MDASAVSRHRNRKGPQWRPLAGAALLAAAFVYVWLVPLYRPRGEFLWGRYRLDDIYLGIPIAVAAICVLVVRAAPGQYRRSLALRLTTSAVALVVAVAMCDVGYAFFIMGAWRANTWLDEAHISRRYSIADDELGFVRQPGVSWRGYVPDAGRFVEYRTDANGFRNPPGPPRADVVFIGDSFSEAATVAGQDTFVRRVERATGRRVVNLARGAYGPQQELIVLERYGLSYQPHVVVWQLFEGNDLADARIFAGWRANPDQGRASLKSRYRDNSLLNALLVNTRTPTRPGPGITLGAGDSSVRANLRYKYDPGEPVTNPVGMAETERAIEAGQRLCESHGIQLIVIVIPTMMRVMAPRIVFDREEDRRTYLPTPAPGQKDVSARVEALCGRIGCSFVDVFAALRDAAVKGARDLYIPNDEHLDVGGHTVVAQAITERVRR